MSEATIDALLTEGRTFPPPEPFKRDALTVSSDLYAEAETDYEGFWARQAAELLDWFEDWHTVL
ncbi:MAG TPA: acetyl-coenzyme A synthetase N-terminal domain-containing protein, partial [Acidimicrobiia bacterium]|nr:acetyl-coenzyme A synthetase N-terminal domain-containing protein [Acidimicrobiia bacterium]